jgi:hypothetical protein
MESLSYSWAILVFSIPEKVVARVLFFSQQDQRIDGQRAAGGNP